MHTSTRLLRPPARAALIASGLLMATATLTAFAGSGYTLHKQVIAAGGAASSGGSYALVATVGQSVSGPTQATGLSLQQGFHPATPAQADGLFQNGFE